jgi:acetyl esterase/lipase
MKLSAVFLAGLTCLATLPLGPLFAQVESVEKKAEVTPLTLPGSEPFVFRKIGESELRLHVVKPAGWSRGDKRPAMLCFFGGGWSSGTPETSINWAKWSATAGLVGIAPDYRTRKRYGGTPGDCVSDARAAFLWVQAHADELGIDPAKIVTQGGSAGGLLAAWTAMPQPGPAKDDTAITIPPAALILMFPESDTVEDPNDAAKRFKGDTVLAAACSVPHHMPAKMPATIIFHGTADVTVPCSRSAALRDKLVAAGNRCELVTFEGLGHSYYSSKFGEAGKAASVKTKQEITEFLSSLGLINVRLSDKKSAALKQ